MGLPEHIFFFVIVAVSGLCLGSFATALIYRIPRDIPWIVDKPSAGKKVSRSQCPSCGHGLGLIDLIPLLSFLSTRGCCRYCRKKIPAFYPLTELTTMILLLVQYWAWGGGTIAAWPVFAAIPFLVAAVLIDWEHFILPDDINIALSVLAVIHVALLWIGAARDNSVPVDHISAAILLTLVFAAVSYLVGKLKGRQALGQGDLKFLPAAGLFLGVAAIPTFLALSGILGLLSALLKGKNREQGMFPFGPALIISLYLHLFLTGLGFDYTW